MRSLPTPVSETDPEKMVLERILTTLDDHGPMFIDDVIEQLHLYEHPAAEKILGMAIGDGMIQESEAEGKIEVNSFGRDVANDIRQSEKVTRYGGGHY
jgi:hypothetical protein